MKFLSQKQQRVLLLVVSISFLFITTNAQYPNAYPSDISKGYFNAHVFATYTTPALGEVSPSVAGTLDGNDFTVSFTNIDNLGHGYPSNTLGGVGLAPASWGPYVLPVASNGRSLPSTTYFVDLMYRGTPIPAGSTGTATFTNNLSKLDHFIVGDIGDGAETIVFEFLDGSGTPVDIATNIKTVHLSDDAVNRTAPLTYPTATQLRLTNAASGVVNEGWAFVMLTNNVRSVRFTQSGTVALNGGQSWSFSFSKGAYDYGDAPASYGNAQIWPLGGLLRLGALGGDTESGPLYSTDASGDNLSEVGAQYTSWNDEDGVSGITPITNSGASGETINTYTITTTVSNRSGTDANVVAWIDWNGNGIFDTNEAATTTAVPTASDNVTRSFTWNNVALNGATGATGTFLRIITATAAINASQASGLIDGIGEIEDYFVPFTTTLPVHFGAINASIKNGQLLVNWQTLTENNNSHFEIEVSKDGNNFTSIGTINSTAPDGNSNTAITYSFAHSAANFAAWLIPLVLGFAGFAKNKKWRIALCATTIALTIGIVSCSKKDATVDKAVTSIWVRIKQIDKDGKFQYSKVVKAATA